MDLPTALLRDLLDLSASADKNGHLDGRLPALVAALRAAVPSYRGLSLTVHDNGQPVSLTSFLPMDREITASLRLPFTALSPTFDPQSRVIFYATTRGAFVDLATDLGHALHAPPTMLAAQSSDLPEDPGTGVQQGAGHFDAGQLVHGVGVAGIVLDADLPPHTLVSQWTGLQEASTINRAIGMLIDRGHPPDDAPAALRRHAAAAGVNTHVYAARLLRR